MKYDHEIIRDLMPLCIDGIASEKSNAAVQEHIAECPACEKEWEQMKKTINTSENVPVPEDTKKYKETAKRVRKKNRWILLKVTLGTLVLALIIGYIGNFIDGARFTARGAAKFYLTKEIASAVYEDPVQAKNAAKPKMTYLGTLKSEDGKAANAFFLMYKPDLDETFLAWGHADRSDLLRLGMWTPCGGSLGPYKDSGISMSGGSFSYENGEKWFGAEVFYVTDEEVKHIEVTMNGQVYELTPDKNGFCGIGYDSADRQMYKAMPFNDSITEGKATDENGRVLYTVQSVTETYGSSEFEHYDWVKASA
ncbi:MAG: zf-HC2 domain-containing protein [Ruminococcus sp.]|nr:zf-HC2 domain-containing protein [Ruminococcus sp.]